MARSKITTDDFNPSGDLGSNWTDVAPEYAEVSQGIVRSVAFGKFDSDKHRYSESRVIAIGEGSYDAGMYVSRINSDVFPLPPLFKMCGFEDIQVNDIIGLELPERRLYVRRDGVEVFSGIAPEVVPNRPFVCDAWDGDNQDVPSM